MYTVYICEYSLYPRGEVDVAISRCRIRCIRYKITLPRGTNRI